jgi:hypothetical protein
MLHIGHGSCTSSVRYSCVSTSIGSTSRQIRSLDNDLLGLGEVLVEENDIGVDEQPDESPRGMELVYRHVESDVTSPCSASLREVSTRSEPPSGSAVVRPTGLPGPIRSSAIFDGSAILRDRFFWEVRKDGLSWTEYVNSLPSPKSPRPHSGAPRRTFPILAELGLRLNSALLSHHSWLPSRVAWPRLVTAWILRASNTICIQRTYRRSPGATSASVTTRYQTSCISQRPRWLLGYCSPAVSWPLTST